MLKNHSNNIHTAIIKYWPCLLVLLAFFCFISKALYNYPIGIMAILGFYKIFRNPKVFLHDKSIKIFTIIFLCLWLPLLISLFGAVNSEHSSHTVFPYLRFLFAGIFIIHEISKDRERLTFIVSGIFFIVLFWCIDATIQFIIGHNILGYPYMPGNITGMFYPRSTIAHICSILSSFFFFQIYIKNKKWLFISILPLFFIILLSGSRASWIMMALSTFCFFIYGYFYSNNKMNFVKAVLSILICITVLLSSTIIFHAPTKIRFNNTLGVFSNNYHIIDQATSYRLPIWETAYSIFKSNPINGIGPRGFRHVYSEYAASNDIHVAINIIPTQPHIIILEILAETGLIGFLGYILSIYFIFLITIKSTNKKLLLPFLIPVAVALFPLNAHMAFYGSIWSSMIWLLLSLFFTKAKLVDIYFYKSL